MCVCVIIGEYVRVHSSSIALAMPITMGITLARCKALGLPSRGRHAQQQRPGAQQVSPWRCGFGTQNRARLTRWNQWTHCMIYGYAAKNLYIYIYVWRVRQIQHIDAARSTRWKLRNHRLNKSRSLDLEGSAIPEIGKGHPASACMCPPAVCCGQCSWHLRMLAAPQSPPKTSSPIWFTWWPENVKSNNPMVDLDVCLQNWWECWKKSI